ncbi:DUF4433 domain-containing protein [Actinobacillus porcinus]|uniref:type II toxin-antitoxin system toxin DNA ADP-ribosyl transferase DarT n=1 Tax=Actinobacillus porcinus TaxID=51048 RepID=UPI002A90B816|nr:DUF4433 domain-containing protein [Actinobacillus porcinus]MDY6215265.1 DUF4433 domain-containing protein [Actinobacillus porcinus]
MNYRDSINSKKALIWRIIHIDNLDWVLENGLHSGNSEIKSTTWVNIGNKDLINRRAEIAVPNHSNTVLNDYIPFYFTPFSPMMMNIHYGRGVEKQKNEDIIILVSSLFHLKEHGIPFVFTDGHACYKWSNFYSDLKNLNKINWDILQTRDFKRDPDDPRKFEEYQAEALVYQSCPITAVLGIIYFNEEVRKIIENKLVTRKINSIKVLARSNWYFS